MKVIFLIPVSSQPRYHKRIAGFKGSGAKVRVLYFDRQYFKGKVFSCSSRCIGELKHGAYMRRLVCLAKTLPIIRREIKDANVIYAFGLDMAFLARVASIGRAKEVNLVYEIGDVRCINFYSTLKGRFFRLLDRSMIRASSKIVVTAPGFANGYLKGTLGLELDSIHVIENKLDLDPLQRPLGKFYIGKRSITIGYFGLLRCSRSWTVLKALAVEGKGMVNVLVRGYPFGVDIDDARNIPGIQFDGEYVVPDDLPKMYSAVDLIWACNSSQSGAEQNCFWARTNRFYESCYFRKPMISLEGGEEGREVERLGIGMTVNLDDPVRLARQLLEILPSKLPQWQHAAAKIPDEICTYTNEHSNLFRSLDKKIFLENS